MLVRAPRVGSVCRTREAERAVEVPRIEGSAARLDSQLLTKGSVVLGPLCWERRNCYVSLLAFWHSVGAETCLALGSSGPWKGHLWSWWNVSVELAWDLLGKPEPGEGRYDEVQWPHLSRWWAPSPRPHLRTHLRVVGFSCYSCWLFFSCSSCWLFFVFLAGFAIAMLVCLLFFSCSSCWLFFSCSSCWLCHCYVSLLAFLFLLDQVRSGSVRLRERYVGIASCRRCGACPTGWDVRQREAEAGEVRPVQARRSGRKILLLRFLIFSKGSSTLTLRKEPGPCFHLLMILEISWGWKPHKLEGNNSLASARRYDILCLKGVRHHGGWTQEVSIMLLSFLIWMLFFLDFAMFSLVFKWPHLLRFRPDWMGFAVPSENRLQIVDGEFDLI